jgi:hypothetical protein
MILLRKNGFQCRVVVHFVDGKIIVDEQTIDMRAMCVSLPKHLLALAVLENDKSHTLDLKGFFFTLL